MKRVYIKVKDREITIPCLGNSMANFIAKLAHKYGQKHDMMFYQVYILED